MATICFIPRCKTNYIKYRLERKKLTGRNASVFKPPKDQDLFEVWKRCVPRADRELRSKDSICERHFKEEDIERFFETKIFDGSIFQLPRTRPKLRTGAIPQIFPEAPGHSSYEIEEDKYQKKKVRTLQTKQKKSRNKKASCSDNTTKQKTDSTTLLGKENILFEGIIIHPVSQSPSSLDPVLFKKRKDNENEYEIDSIFPNSQNCLISQSESSHINLDDKCVLFKENNEAENNMNSAPSPFDNSVNEPESSSIISPTGDDLVQDYLVPNICETILAESDVVLPKSVLAEQFSFNFLKINVDMVDTMNPWWKVQVLDDFISFNRYLPDFTIERRLVITKDLAVKVFLKDKETTIGSDLQVISIDIISKLIFRVEKSILCSGINKKDRNCAGFLQGVLQCKRYNLCLNCIQFEKEQKKLLNKPVRIPSDLVELIRFNYNK